MLIIVTYEKICVKMEDKVLSPRILTDLVVFSEVLTFLNIFKDGGRTTMKKCDHPSQSAIEYMGLSENRVNIPKEIAIKNRDNDQQNHWVDWGTLFSDTPI